MRKKSWLAACLMAAMLPACGWKVGLVGPGR